MRLPSIWMELKKPYHAALFRRAPLRHVKHALSEPALSCKLDIFMEEKLCPSQLRKKMLSH